jgi:2-polyprenyl-3-methyl-5-hydroxy-6-metoxy-1,4-benzoquinol methylase
MNETPPEVLRPIAEIMHRHGARCTAEEFHAAVNVTFHEFESEVYDQEHGDMWSSLPRQFGLLADDYFSRYPDASRQFRLLDIGCGTGLATDCILGTQFQGRISHITLLDTSPAMLRQASRRAATWKIPLEARQGLLHDLPAGEKYDLIITCSVLHHIPDLEEFLGGVRRHQADRGVFLHLQDPNGDYAKDPELQQRTSQMPRDPKPNLAQRALGRLYRELTGKQGDNYLIKTNKALMQKGVIATPLTPVEIYSITDIHVESGEGISIQRMKSWMPDYDCLSQRAYGFFGTLWSNLPEQKKSIEEDLSGRRALNGLHVGAVWTLR